VLATGYRYNAAAATFPLVLGLYGWGKQITWRRRYLPATAIWLGVTASALLANRLVTEKHIHPWETSAAPLEIAGVINYADDLDNDQLLRDTEGVPWTHTDKLQERVRALYSPTHSYLDVTQGDTQIIEYPKDREQQKAIAAAWKKLVFAHPLA